MAASTSTSLMLFPFPSTHKHIRLIPFPPPPPSLSLTTPSSKSTKLFAHNINNSSTTEHTKSNSSADQQQLPNSWRQIHGENNWAGLLEPMNPILRQELIRYGEMAQACYDAFDFDPFSIYCGNCRFTRHDFFSSLDISHHSYTVTRYLYATANINLPNFFKQSRWSKMWSKHANWAGYVAVSNSTSTKILGRRDITIAWRGTDIPRVDRGPYGIPHTHILTLYPLPRSNGQS